MPLFHLVYESRASRPLSDPELQKLLQYSRHYNAQHELTGLLLYSSEGRFLQVLEGPQAEVMALYQRISSDARHLACVVLLSGPLVRRRFGEWRMGFRAARHHTDLPALLGYVDTSSPDFLLPSLPQLSTSLLDRLLDYVQQTPVPAGYEEQEAQ